MAKGASLHGMSELKRAFRALPDVAREAIADATEETAEQIRAGAVRRVPVRYGFLRDHIAKKMSRKTGVAVVVVGIARGTATLPDGRTVRPSRYAHFAEFGTSHHEAQPFVLPSVEEQRNPYLQRAKAAGATIERNMATIGGRFL